MPSTLLFYSSLNIYFKDLVPEKYTFEMYTNVRMFLNYIVENVIEKTGNCVWKGDPESRR